MIFHAKIQDAWDLISDTAGACLQPSAGRKRSLVPEPTQAAQAPVKVEALQSMRERKLRRPHRRLMKLRKISAPWSLVRKVRQDIASFCPSFPELAEIEFFSSEILQVVEDCILKENTASQEERLNNWRLRMRNDEAVLIHWVKGADNRWHPLPTPMTQLSQFTRTLRPSTLLRFGVKFGALLQYPGRRTLGLS